MPLITLEGLELDKAEKLLSELGLVPQIHEEASAAVEAGKVIRQDPAATTDVPNGSVVDLWVSTGPDTSAGGEGESQVILIPLPDDRDTVKIEAFQDDMEILNMTVNCAEWAYNYPPDRVRQRHGLCGDPGGRAAEPGLPRGDVRWTVRA